MGLGASVTAYVRGVISDKVVGSVPENPLCDMTRLWMFVIVVRVAGSVPVKLLKDTFNDLYRYGAQRGIQGRKIGSESLAPTMKC